MHTFEGWGKAIDKNVPPGLVGRRRGENMLKTKTPLNPPLTIRSCFLTLFSRGEGGGCEPRSLMDKNMNNKKEHEHKKEAL